MFDNWYAVQVRTGKEDDIVKQCNLLINHSYFEECFIPRCSRIKNFKGKRVYVEEILFKGYIFIISDYIEDLYNDLKKIPDLTKVLGNDGSEIYPIKKEEAMFLSSFSGENHIVEMSYGFIEGDTIRVTNGPLKGQEGHIVKIDRHKRIAYVEISMFDRITRVQVGLEIIYKI